MIFPPKLEVGDRVAIVAPSRSLGGLITQGSFSTSSAAGADAVLRELGLQPSLAANVHTCDDALSAPVEARIADLEAAYRDPEVKGIFCVAGGSNAIQLLRHLDFDLIATHPKILCGYSDIGTLLNAIHAVTGVVGYYGPNYAGLTQRFEREYTLSGIRRCLFDTGPFEVVPASRWSDDGEESFTNDGPYTIVEGAAHGTFVGGGLHCLSVLQGTLYFPPIDGAILLLESPLCAGKATLAGIDATLDSLIYQPEFVGVRALVFGKFLRRSGITRERLEGLVRSKPELASIPVVAGMDFGHTLPRLTLPIGGRGEVEARQGHVVLRVTDH